MCHAHDLAARQIFESPLKEQYAYVQWWSFTGTDREDSTRLSEHPKNVAGVGLQDLANQANQTEECNSRWPIILYMWKRALKMEFVGHEIWGLKIPAHDYHSDDDVSELSNSDSDILATVEKADFGEFLDDNSWTLAGSEGDLDT